MNTDKLIAFQSSEPSASFSDALTELIRQGARQIIAKAVETELQLFLAQNQSLKGDLQQQMVVRNGDLPECTTVTEVGEVDVRVPKVRDCNGSGYTNRGIILKATQSHW